jgi:hypothetical protein
MNITGAMQRMNGKGNLHHPFCHRTRTIENFNGLKILHHIIERTAIFSRIKESRQRRERQIPHCVSLIDEPLFKPARLIHQKFKSPFTPHAYIRDAIDLSREPGSNENLYPPFADYSTDLERPSIIRRSFLAFFKPPLK